MFSLPLIQESTKARTGLGIWVSELVSTLVLLSDPDQQYAALTEPAALSFIKAAEIPMALHFIPNPGPSLINSDALSRKITP
jgi:hypothetical protein